MSTWAPGPARVSVPATSANLGPGFDSLGVALDLRDELRAEVVEGPLTITVEGEGADEVPLTHEHLVHVALARGLEALGRPVPGLRLHCRNVVPHARGLGSSSAAIIGGLVLARALVPDGADRLDDEAVLALAVAMEGHPDNVAPALYGGFTVCASGGGRLAVVRRPVASGVCGVVLVPPTRLSTEAARGLLPATVPHAVAAANAGRAALLSVALTDAPEHLLTATEDALHQEQRRPAMPDSLALVDRLRADGVAAVVSGAGPTVLALVPPAAVEAVVAATPAGWDGRVVDLGGPGARVEH